MIRGINDTDFLIDIGEIYIDIQSFNQFRVFFTLLST